MHGDGVSNDNILEQIIRKIRWDYVMTRPGKRCPSSDTLVEYVYGGLSGDDHDHVRMHLSSCEICRMVCYRARTDELLWSNMLESAPDALLSRDLGRSGIREVNNMIRSHERRRTPSLDSFVSRVRENMVAWVSPLWQPLYAGEAVTAADLAEQSIGFEMDYGEYINLSCHWHEEKDRPACIELSWQANLLQPSRLWARFIDPENSTILTEILLGKELEGRLCIPGEQLNFNPTADKWAIAIIVEEERGEL